MCEIYLAIYPKILLFLRFSLVMLFVWFYFITVCFQQSWCLKSWVASTFCHCYKKSKSCMVLWVCVYTSISVQKLFVLWVFLNWFIHFNKETFSLPRVTFFVVWSKICSKALALKNCFWLLYFSRTEVIKFPIKLKLKVP